jgi:hypothetical protein
MLLNPELQGDEINGLLTHVGGVESDDTTACVEVGADARTSFALKNENAADSSLDEDTEVWTFEEAS